MGMKLRRKEFQMSEGRYMGSPCVFPYTGKYSVCDEACPAAPLRASLDFGAILYRERLLREADGCVSSDGGKGYRMPTVLKVFLVCVLCIGLITGIVYLIKWLF
jgi:hypothetical protein